MCLVIFLCWADVCVYFGVCVCMHAYALENCLRNLDAVFSRYMSCNSDETDPHGNKPRDPMCMYVGCVSVVAHACVCCVNDCVCAFAWFSDCGQ